MNLDCARCHKPIEELQPYFKQDDGSVLCWECKREPQPVEQVKGDEG